MENEAFDGTVSGLQESVDRWIKEIGGGYFSELTNMALLTEEVGELASVVARRYGDQVSKKGDGESLADLREEIADVLWVLICIANQTGVSLEEAFRETLRKKTLRDRHRFRK